ncbi:MAG: glycosyltransferase family 1 protein, partial [candidate division Zixibacteria bacterium]|nr:glycosyltransferase family 1 protein [candidate division Zixibacteria bacterium]
MITKSSTRNSLDSMESKITGKDIICISSMPYGEMWTRKQRLMTIFAEMGNKVLYVEPVESIFASHGNQDSLKPSFKEIKKNLYVLHPGGRLPFARFGFIRDMNLKRYANTVKEYAGKLDFHKPVMFTYLPVIHAHSPFEQLRDYFDISLLIYDCVDEHSETIGYTSEAAEIVHNWDLDLTKKADLTFVTARGLYEDRKHLSDDIYFSPNGADIKHFSKALDDSTEIPSDIAEIPEPRIGFVGSMSDWIDYDLIAEIAKSYPKSSVVLVGPVKGGMKPGIL